MRSYKAQALINFIRLIPKKGYWRKWLWQYGWQWINPIKSATNSTIYSIEEIGRTRGLICKLGQFDKDWFIRIFEPETKGVRAWEYGKLLSRLENLPKGKILDVGAGGSLMADYLASKGWEVTSLDLEKQMEKRYQGKNNKVKYVTGDMTKMTFKNRTFDVVMSISAIEHLESWGKTIMALNEMKRVVKRSGRIFVSTDFYLKRQTTDNWAGGMKSAYGFDKLKQIAKILKAEVKPDRERRKLIKSPKYSNFRGRYFTTIFLEGQP
jgi:2-polyprenyl-3-methyl-5-hydroxy-6-metoxy-1,4-benzoquinol methylase